MDLGKEWYEDITSDSWFVRVVGPVLGLFARSEVATPSTTPGSTSYRPKRVRFNSQRSTL